MSHSKKDEQQTGLRPEEKVSISLNAEVRLAVRDEVEERVEKQVQKVEEHYIRQFKTLWWAFAAVNVAILIVFSLFGVSTWQDAKEKFLNSTDVAKRTKEITDMNDEATNILSQMRSNFSEFNSRLSEIKAQDNVVTSEDLTNKLRILDSHLANAQKLLDKLQEAYNVDVANIEIADDKKPTWPAFKVLLEIASRTNSPFADNALSRIMAAISSLQTINTPNQPWTQAVNIKPDISFGEAERGFNSAIGRYVTAQWCYFIGNNEQFTEYQRLHFLVAVNQGSDYVECRAMAALILDKIANLNLPAFQASLEDPFNKVEINNWWDQNKSRYP